MGRHHVQVQAHMIRFSLLGAAFAAPLLASLAAPALAAEAANGALPDMVIQAEDKRPVSRVKPALDLPVKIDQPLEADVETDDGVRARVPSDLNKTSAFAPGLSQSPLSALPSSSWIAEPYRGESVRALFPKRELQAVEANFVKTGRWELVIADSQGKAFRRYSGEGVPPDQLDFDGKDDTGEWLTVGHAYTPVLTYHDGSGRARTAMGRPFALAGLSLDNPRAIWMAPRVLFTSASVPELSPEGKALLREAAQLVQRHHAGLGLELSVRLARDAAWVKGAGDLCVKELARHLLIKPESITLKPAPGTADLKERIEIAAVAR